MTIPHKNGGNNEKDKILLRGLGVSQGKATGNVRIIKSSSDIGLVSDGDVIVTYMTNPDMILALMKATALVTDVGGMLCHAAIVARELGIPCVVDTKEASTKLMEGMKVTVDGFKGVVY